MHYHSETSLNTKVFTFYWTCLQIHPIPSLWYCSMAIGILLKPLLLLQYLIYQMFLKNYYIYKFFFDVMLFESNVLMQKDVLAFLNLHHLSRLWRTLLCSHPSCTMALTNLSLPLKSLILFWLFGELCCITLKRTFRLFCHESCFDIYFRNATWFSR